MSSKNTKLSQRFSIIIIVVIIISCLILYKAGQTVFIDREGWLTKVSQLKVEDKTIDPVRGNIFASDGRLMASSIPQYYVYIDFKADGLRKDSLMNNMDALCKTLAQRFGERTPAGWRAHIMRGYNSQSRYYRLIRRRISYTEKKDFATIPFLKYPPHKSGVQMIEMAQRIKPFGSLASRTIGDVYGDQSKGGKNGLELAYDSLLRGTPGIGTRQKLVGRYYTTAQVEPVNGVNITTTIDIDIQDITQTALMNKLAEIEAESGTAVVMEVKTGAIKAISNLGRTSSGQYMETKNYAVSDESEPGSTFKVASMMVALDSGYVHPNDSVDTGPGYYFYKGARMTDHNINHGGYHTISAAQTIWYSSNIGVAKIILKGYENNPSAYVEALYRIGLNEPFDLDIPGAGRPKIRHPKDQNRYWSKTSLSWMSFGYETQIPPIYTLAFYNAIANDGCMVKPYFVKSISKEGTVIKQMETQVIRNQICKESTLKEIRQMLLDVVEQGTGKPVKSERLKIAGKTGTAQISRGKAGYRSGGVSHQVSFCGYFPADHPIYSCIVVIRNPRIGYASGGTMAGGVFKHIAECTYAQSCTLPIERDTVTQYLPMVKSGNYKAITYVLSKLQLPCEDKHKDWDWATTSSAGTNISLKEFTLKENIVPSVKGMGAKDAVYLLENMGLRVHLSGMGKVSTQSKPAGQRFRKGETIALYLK